jgi:hypothetical protein
VSGSDDMNATMLSAVEILRRSGCSPRQASLALICALAATLVESEHPPTDMAERISHIFWRLRLAKLKNAAGEAPELN